MLERNIETTRVIARLDAKDKFLVKPIQLDGLKKLGLIDDFALEYSNSGIDEIIYIDSVASLFGVKPNFEVIRKVGRECNVPLTVAGAIRSVDDALNCLDCGADKVAINTAAIKNPNLIEKIALVLGSQSVVLSVEAFRTKQGKIMASYCSGKEISTWDAKKWVKSAEDMGAGEVVLTSVDREGTRTGFDIELVKEIESECNLPLIVSGGMGSIEHAIDLLQNVTVDGLAIADFFHYERGKIGDLKQSLLQNNFEVIKNG